MRNVKKDYRTTLTKSTKNDIMLGKLDNVFPENGKH